MACYSQAIFLTCFKALSTAGIAMTIKVTIASGIR